MLDWRGNLSACVCSEKEAPDWESCEALQHTAENVMLDFVWGSVLKCITPN
jgi:hypothetical protein